MLLISLCGARGRNALEPGRPRAPGKRAFPARTGQTSSDIEYGKYAAEMGVNWEAWGAIGEIVGAIAVAITLLFLAIQTRQNTKSLRAGAIQELLAKSTDIYLASASDDKLMGIMADVLPTNQELNPAQQAKLTYMLLGVLSNIQIGFIQHEVGNLDSTLFETYRERTKRVIRSTGAGFANIWTAHKNEFTPAFRDWIDDLRERIDAD